MQTPIPTSISRADYVNTHQQMRDYDALSGRFKQIQTEQQQQNAVGVGGQQREWEIVWGVDY